LRFINKYTGAAGGGVWASCLIVDASSIWMRHKIRIAILTQTQDGDMVQKTFGF